MKQHRRYTIVRRSRSLRLLLFAVIGSIVLTAYPAAAGTICGTVQDALTGGGINRAGIFVRSLDGTYTGYHGATNELGEFCIDEIPPGTYDLEVRVDNYVTEYIRNIEVTDDPTSVQIDLDVPVYFSPPWPNPAQSSVSFRFRTSEGTPVRLLIYDPLGRLVHGWSDPAGSQGERFFTWNLRDGNNIPVPSGIYFAHLSAGSVTITRSIVVLK